MLEANKGLVRRRFEEIFNRKNLAICDESMAEDFVERAHAPFAQSDNAEREMLGSSRLKNIVTKHTPGAKRLTAYLVEELGRFTGEWWEQEDDITLVTLQLLTARDRA